MCNEVGGWGRRVGVGCFQFGGVGVEGEVGVGGLRFASNSPLFKSSSRQVGRVKFARVNTSASNYHVYEKLRNGKICSEYSRKNYVSRKL